MTFLYKYYYSFAPVQKLRLLDFFSGKRKKFFVLKKSTMQFFYIFSARTCVFYIYKISDAVDDMPRADPGKGGDKKKKKKMKEHVKVHDKITRPNFNFVYFLKPDRRRSVHISIVKMQKSIFFYKRVKTKKLYEHLAS